MKDKRCHFYETPCKVILFIADYWTGHWICDRVSSADVAEISDAELPCNRRTLLLIRHRVASSPAGRGLGLKAAGFLCR